MKYRVILVGRTHERKFNILLSFVSYCERKIANGGPYQVIWGGGGGGGGAIIQHLVVQYIDIKS
jgi:hypothetical protein